MGIVKRNSILITILSYVGVAIGYVNKVLLFPNFLSEEQVGLTGILLTIAVMYAQFSAVGVNSSIIRFFPFFRTPDKRNNGLFFWSALIISVGFILFTVLFFLFRESVTGYFSENSPLLSHYYLLIIPLGLATLFYNFYSTWLQALSRTVMSSGVYDVLLRLLITADISLYALGVISFEQFLAAYILVHFVPTLVLLVYTAVIGESYCKPVISPRTKRLLYVFGMYGLWQFFGSVSLYMIPVIDQAMLAGIQGLAQGGIFVVMLNMVGVLQIPYRSLLKVSTPLVAGYWKRRDMKGMSDIYRNVSLTNLILGCGLFVLIWINLNNIFSLMPESYSAGRYVFLFLALGRIVDMYTGLNGVILVTSKRFRYDLFFSLFLVGLTVFTNALFIPMWGMTGAALATMITLVIHNFVRVFFVWRFYNLHPFAWRDLLVVVLTIAVLLLNTLLPQMGGFIVDVAVRSSVIMAIFAAVVYFSKMSPQINALVLDVMAIVRRKF